MEQFVESLFKRLDQTNQLKLYVIMQNAINEVHNSGVLLSADPTGTSKLHDRDPEVRVTEKTKLAKSIGKSFIPSALPGLGKDGTLSYQTQVNYNPAFKNCICICLQGGLEGLHLSLQLPGITQNRKVKYNLTVVSNGNDLTEFKELISSLNTFYDDIDIAITSNDSGTSTVHQTADKEPAEVNAYAKQTPEIIQKSPEPNTRESAAPRKKGFFAKLFGKQR